MELSVKTLTGKVFAITVDPASNVGQVKGVIEATNSEFKADSLKLIHSGKVLKDEQTLTEVGVKEKDFLVVMATKAKKAAAPAPPANSAAEPAPTPAAAASAAVEPAPTATPAAPAAPPPLDEAAVAALRDMGFPEAEARTALEAATRVGGGQQLAVEFLMNGIPPNFPPAGTPMQAPPAEGAAPAPGGTAAPAGTGLAALQQLRQHPQFNQMRQLVQENPAALQPLIEQIGASQPGLLDAIRANTAEFLAMLNEPMDAAAPGGAAPAGMGGMPAGGPTPQQLAQVYPQLPAEQQAQIAQQFGMTPVQFGQMIQMMGQMTPEQLQAMGMPAGGMPGMGGQGQGQPPAGANVIQLTQEEAAAVQRLQQLGFSQREAAEAYLACDKNEELAANFLFDSMGGGGGWEDAPMAPMAAAPAPAAPAPAAPTPAAPTAAPTEPATTTPAAPGDEPAPAPDGPSGGNDDDDDEMYN